MVNIELRLLAKMLYTGDFTPIQQGDITTDHFKSETGLILINFVLGYGPSTNGAARWPSLSVVRSRFVNNGIELPDPDPGETLGSLVHETQHHKLQADLTAMAVELDTLAKSSDDLVEPLIKKQVAMRRMTDKLQRARHVSLAEGFADVLADYDTGVILPNGMPWPWPSMQHATKGLHRKEFVVIAGRPKSRKTFTALDVACSAFVNHNARVLIFTPEMPRRQILLRCIAFICGLRYTEFKDSNLDEIETLRLLETARLYGKMAKENEDSYGFRLHHHLALPRSAKVPSLDIVESTGRSVPWMESQIELFQPDLVLADSFYRQTPEGGKRNDTDWKQMSNLSRSMKDLAMTSDICLLGTHQMNREAEGKIGSLSNLALADAFGQDMDLGLRVITGKIEGKDVSAVVTLGGREVPFDGILINNVPCCDYTERGIITNHKMVEDLMKSEDDQDAKDEAEKARRKAHFGSKTSGKIVKAGEMNKVLVDRVQKGIEKDVNAATGRQVSEGEQ